jgi:hypothetical protein
MCLSAGEMKSTIIVVIRSGDTVVVAADSRRTNLDGQVVNDSTCKIRTLGKNRFLVGAGATRSLEMIDPIRAARSLTSTEEIAESFERRLIPLLRQMSEVRHRDEPKNQRYIKGGSLLVFVAIGRTGDNQVGWSMRDYTAWSVLNPSQGGRDDAIRNSCPGACPRPELLLSGSTSEAARRARDLWGRKPPAELAEELVRIQMLAEPANVGGDVTVLLVTAKTHQWIKPGACSTQ